MGLRSLIWVFLGGGLGSALRYGASVALARSLGTGPGTGFPYATLTVNLVGSFLLGALIAGLPGTEGGRGELKLALGTGVLGGFTTYSTFSLEAFGLLHTEPGRGALYVALTLVGCFAGTAAGWFLGRALATH